VTLKSRTGEGTLFTLLVPACAPLAMEARTETGTPAGKVHCIGNSDDLRASAELLGHWGYEVVCRPSGHAGPELKDSVVIADQDALGALCGGQAPPMPVIVLARETPGKLPEGVHALPLPLRPAKLRALLGQLQKALSKSMP